MTTILQGQDNAIGQVLYMALELSNKKWKLGFSNGAKVREVTIEAGDLTALRAQIALAKEKLRLDSERCHVRSCYEAGRDGFWIHRYLVEQGLENAVIDSSSIEVNRRKRRAKTDSVDVQSLLRLLIRYCGGEKKVMSVVRVPSVEEEDCRRLHRERERLLKERGAHTARIKSLLVAHGIRQDIADDFLTKLEASESACGYQLGEELKEELKREYKRYQLVAEQANELEQTQRKRVEAAGTKSMQQIDNLMQLKGVGWQSSWILTMEFFSWRNFRNRREL